MPDAATRAIVETWLLRHRLLVDRAVTLYLADGEWPRCDALQRDLDRRNIDDDVSLAARTMPTLTGQLTTSGDENFRLPLYVLRSVPMAEDLVVACLQLVQRAAELYFSDTEQPRLESDDRKLGDTVGQPKLLRRALDAVRLSSPQPLGSGHSSSTSWSFEINGDVARRLTGIRTIDDYIDRQIEILAVGSNSLDVPPKAEAGGANPNRGYHIGGLYVLAAAVIGGLIAGYFTLRSNQTDKAGSKPSPPANDHDSKVHDTSSQLAF